jgi:hypothetical protein
MQVHSQESTLESTVAAPAPLAPDMIAFPLSLNDGLRRDQR